jgi:tRNA(Ile)-lysidine synthase
MRSFPVLTGAMLKLQQQLQQQLQQAILSSILVMPHADDEPTQAPQASRHIVLAFSGGLDSMVLLHLLSTLRTEANWRVQAVHVHHQLQPDADQWAEFCALQAASYQIDFHLCRVQLAQPEHNIEHQARALRYEALAGLLQPNSLLLTAHHADDQLETMLLALKRGSGLHGFSGIAAQKPFATGFLLRPLLSFSRSQLEQYATACQLPYVTDPSNSDDSFDRNFLRQHILPILQQRFPAISQTAARSCQMLQQSLIYQQQQLQVEVNALLRDGQLDLALLSQIQNPARDLVFREYLRQFDLHPSAEQTAEFMRSFLYVTPDAAPQLCWDEWQLRRFDNLLYLLDGSAQQLADTVLSGPIALPFEQITCVSQQQFFWSQNAVAPASDWSSLPLAASPSQQLWLDFGQLNRRFKPAGSQLSKALKDWCKLWKVPPWRRGSVPFIIAGQQNEVVAVTGFASQCTPAAALSWLHVRSLDGVTRS